jgi:hypothetical protein
MKNKRQMYRKKTEWTIKIGRMKERTDEKEEIKKEGGRMRRECEE